MARVRSFIPDNIPIADLFVGTLRTKLALPNETRAEPLHWIMPSEGPNWIVKAKPILFVRQATSQRQTDSATFLPWLQSVERI